MARRCYPPIKIPGTSLAGEPTAYWDFCALDTAGEGTQPPVAWTHGAAVTLDNDGTPECVTPAAYYNQNAAAKSEQSSTLYRNGTATWFFVFRFDGNPASPSACVASKASPGSAGDSQYGFVLHARTTAIVVHMKATAGTEVERSVTITPANTVLAVAFSFNSSSYRISCNGTASTDGTTPASFSVGNYPLVIGNRTDTYWGIYKGHILRVATWQGIAATAAEMNKLTALFADGCTNGFLQNNALMFSCNS